MPDHVHMLISIPPKYSVAQVIGYIKGKSAIHVARTFDARDPVAPAVFYVRARMRACRSGIQCLHLLNAVHAPRDSAGVGRGDP
jgi:hypothetical protein